MMTIEDRSHGPDIPACDGSCRDWSEQERLGALELLDHFIARTERLDPRINAIVVRDFDRARARARELDSRPDKSAPLFGVPTTVKESFDVAGLPTTRGHADLASAASA